VTTFYLVGPDFAHGGIAGALAGAPHVPACDRTVGAPAFAEGKEFLGLGHALFAVGDGPAFFHSEVVDGEDVRAAEAEDQKHFDGPGADAADGDEAFDEFFVGEGLRLFECGDNALDRFLREVFHGEDFCAGKAGFAEDRFAELEHFLRSGDKAVGAERLDAAEDGGGGFAGDGLISDGFEKDFVGGIELLRRQLEGNSIGDELGEFFVASRKMSGRGGEIERHGRRRSHG